jgi:hypothetical protein
MFNGVMLCRRSGSVGVYDILEAPDGAAPGRRRPSIVAASCARALSFFRSFVCSHSLTHSLTLSKQVA